jgi:hypothetical protein
MVQLGLGTMLASALGLRGLQRYMSTSFASYLHTHFADYPRCSDTVGNATLIARFPRATAAKSSNGSRCSSVRCRPASPPPPAAHGPPGPDAPLAAPRLLSPALALAACADKLALGLGKYALVTELIPLGHPPSGAHVGSFVKNLVTLSGA